MKSRLGKPRLITSHTSSGFSPGDIRMAYSCDGRLLAATGGLTPDDGFGAKTIVHVWETATGKERIRFIGENSRILCLGFSSDGRRLATGCMGSTILIWDVTGRLEHEKSGPLQLSADTMDQLWSDLAGDDAEKAGRAVWTFASARSPAVTFLAKRLRPALGSPVALTTVTRLIADLDAPTSFMREQARQKLLALAEIAESSICESLTNKPSERKRRVLQELVEEIERRRGFLSGGEELRNVRAIEVLEHIGTSEACRVLETLGAGAACARQSEEAQASLARLSGLKP